MSGLVAPGTLFEASFLLVVPFWIAMIALPGWRPVERVLRSPWIVVPAAALYAVLVVPRLGQVLAVVAGPDLDGVSALLGSDAGATLAWVHFLAFDLFVGRWIYLDGRRNGLRWWWNAPLLVATLMVGPVGLLAYLLLRRWIAPGPAAAARPEAAPA